MVVEQSSVGLSGPSFPPSQPREGMGSSVVERDDPSAVATGDGNPNSGLPVDPAGSDSFQIESNLRDALQS